MTLFPPPMPAREPRLIAPGAVHLPGWLDLDRQRALVTAFHEWAAGPVPIRAASLPGGHRMSVRTVCLGWHWQPYRYSRTAEDGNGRRVLAVPSWLADLGRAALAEAHRQADVPDRSKDWSPDTALVNFYDAAARMGMHQDKDEISNEPVVSLSVGDTCRFRFGNTDNRGQPYTDVDLISGDAFVFGGASRFAYHGVPKIYPNTADAACGLTAGRINITLRVTGLH